MLSYFVPRTKRYFKVRLAAARRRGLLEPRRLLRSFLTLVLGLTLLSASPRTDGRALAEFPTTVSTVVTEAAPSDFSGGQVAGKETSTPRPTPPTYPLRMEGSADLPELTAAAIMVTDGETGKVLYEKNPHGKLPPASLTKIMTALVALEGYSLDEVFSVSPECLQGLEGKSQMGLVSGEAVSVETLLYGLLLNSASDAACVLAQGTQEEQAFVGLMNERAGRLGLLETHFRDPVGLDDESQYASPADLLILAKAAMRNPVFRKIVGTAEAVRSGEVGGKIQWHNLKSTNELLKNWPGVTGVKTGRTGEAGECLLASWVWGGRELFAVILGSEDRFAETRVILEWVRQSFLAHP